MAIDTDGVRAIRSGLTNSEWEIDKLVMQQIQKLNLESEVGCTVVQISAFEAPTRFQRLPLWPFMCENKLQWVDIAFDALTAARSARSAKHDSGYM